MDLRTTPNPLIRGAVRSLKRLNDRHPWDHNQHFHRWILRALPSRCESVLDVGCGRGDLVAVLAERIPRVDGIDPDPMMAEVADARFRGDPRVRIYRASFEEITCGGAGDSDRATARYDAITMVASLHHMDLERALAAADGLLRPGGHLLVVALTASRGPLDTAWDALNVLANPVIGLIKHPRPATAESIDTDMPVRDPAMGFAELRTRTRAVLPGARLRRREGFRVTLAWQKPPEHPHHPRARSGGGGPRSQRGA